MCTSYISKIFWPLLLSSLVSQLYAQSITPETARSDDNFGYSVAIDGVHAVIGAPGTYIGQLDIIGAIYFYYWNGTAWVENGVEYGTDIGSRMGAAVAMSNNYVVATEEGSIFGEAPGAIKIYEYVNSTWSYVTNLAVNGEDITTTNIAIYGDNVIANNYIFSKQNSNWGEPIELPVDAEKTISTSNVAISNSFALVGAKVFEKRGTNWIEMGTLATSAGPISATSSSMTDNHIVLGVRGAIYIFERDGSNWHEVQKISWGETKEYFGESVSNKRR